MNDLAAPNVNDASHMNDFADAKYECAYGNIFNTLR